MRLRVLVLMHEELVPPPVVDGLTAEQMRPWRMEYDVMSTLAALGHHVLPLAVADELRPIRQAIDDWRPHIAFNLLRSFHGVGLYDAYVVSYLELLKLPYTGASPRGLLIASDKALAKKILAWHRIPVPGFTVFKKGYAVHSPKRLDYPLFVKSVIEHASLGIAQASVVHDERTLRERVEFVHRRIETDALVESYIEGRELTVGIVGNERLDVFPVWEMTFDNLPETSAPIATARIKWDSKYQAKIGVRTGPARSLTEPQRAAIQRLAKRVYRALDLVGFARLDMRMTPDGRIYVLEANPNCDLAKEEDFAAAAGKHGLDYPQLIQRIVRLGLRYRPAWKEGEGT
jgi:D-alanine-D-alanine ligase